MTGKTYFATAAWAFVILAMFGALLAYSTKAGAPGKPPTHWPQQTAIDRDEDRTNIIVFAHPHCPCTQATLAEFARLHMQFKDKMNATIVLYQPLGQEDEWVHGAIYRAASRIQGLTVIRDLGGETAKRFGVNTSGHVLAYKADGLLGYSGGLTASRGHEGLSNGTVALREVMKNQRAIGLTEYAVFGCPIVEATAADDDGRCPSPS